MVLTHTMSSSSTESSFEIGRRMGSTRSVEITTANSINEIILPLAMRLPTPLPAIEGPIMDTSGEVESELATVDKMIQELESFNNDDEELLQHLETRDTRNIAQLRNHLESWKQAVGEKVRNYLESWQKAQEAKHEQEDIRSRETEDLRNLMRDLHNQTLEGLRRAEKLMDSRRAEQAGEIRDKKRMNKLLVEELVTRKQIEEILQKSIDSGVQREAKLEEDYTTLQSERDALSHRFSELLDDVFEDPEPEIPEGSNRRKHKTIDMNAKIAQIALEAQRNLALMQSQAEHQLQTLEAVLSLKEAELRDLQSQLATLETEAAQQLQDHDAILAEKDAEVEALLCQIEKTEIKAAQELKHQEILLSQKDAELVALKALLKEMELNKTSAPSRVVGDETRIQAIMTSSEPGCARTRAFSCKEKKQKDHPVDAPTSSNNIDKSSSDQLPIKKRRQSKD